MNIKTDERYLGFNQYGITTKEAKTLCGKLPNYGREKLVNTEVGNFWIGHITFKYDHKFRPVNYPFYASLTDWKLVSGHAVLSA